MQIEGDWGFDKSPYKINICNHFYRLTMKNKKSKS